MSKESDIGAILETLKRRVVAGDTLRAVTTGRIGDPTTKLIDMAFGVPTRLGRSEVLVSEVQLLNLVGSIDMLRDFIANNGEKGEEIDHADQPYFVYPRENVREIHEFVQGVASIVRPDRTDDQEYFALSAHGFSHDAAFLMFKDDTYELVINFFDPAIDKITSSVLSGRRPLTEMSAEEHGIVSCCVSEFQRLYVLQSGAE